MAVVKELREDGTYWPIEVDASEVESYLEKGFILGTEEDLANRDAAPTEALSEAEVQGIENMEEDIAKEAAATGEAQA